MGPDGEERRHNHRMRSRLSAIQTGYERWTHITYRGLVTIALTLIVTAGALGYLYAQNRRALRQIQTERQRSLRATCRRDNGQNTAIRAFIHEAAPRRLEERARTAFPLRNCDRYVLENVKAKP